MDARFEKDLQARGRPHQLLCCSNPHHGTRVVDLTSTDSVRDVCHSITRKNPWCWYPFYGAESHSGWVQCRDRHWIAWNGRDRSCRAQTTTGAQIARDRVGGPQLHVSKRDSAKTRSSTRTRLHRSPPTFKSTKASRGDLLEGAGKCACEHSKSDNLYRHPPAGLLW